MSVLHEKWFDKARNDLDAAKILIDSGIAPSESICFHCQQATEKFLKGYLVWKEIEFQKRHDLDYLLDLCIAADETFSVLDVVAESMNGYAIEIRYPEESVNGIHSAEDARMALKDAERVAEFVRSKVGEEHGK